MSLSLHDERLTFTRAVIPAARGSIVTLCQSFPSFFSVLYFTIGDAIGDAIGEMRGRDRSNQDT